MKIASILFMIPLLTGCAGKRMIGVDMANLTGSPCVDGVIYNIKQAGCEVFYWGQTEKNGMKMRCTYSDHDSFYTKSSFYALPPGVFPELNEPFTPWCGDPHAMVFVVPPKNESKTENNQ